MTLIRTEGEKQCVCPITPNRTRAVSEVDKRAGHCGQVSPLDLKPNERRVVSGKGVDCPVLRAQHVLTHTDGSGGVGYLVSRDTAVTDEQLTDLSPRRWTVAAFPKALKQNAAVEQSPTRTVTTQTNHIFAAMLALIKLEMLKWPMPLNHCAVKGQLSWRAIQTCFKELKRLQQQFHDAPIQFNMGA